MERWCAACLKNWRMLYHSNHHTALGFARRAGMECWCAACLKKWCMLYHSKHHPALGFARRAGKECWCATCLKKWCMLYHSKHHPALGFARRAGKECWCAACLENNACSITQNTTPPLVLQGEQARSVGVLLAWRITHALSLRTPHRPWFCKESRQGVLVCCCCCCLRLRRLHHMIMRGCRQWTPAPSTDAITYIHAGGLTHYSVHTRTHTLTHYIDNICAPITHTH